MPFNWAGDATTPRRIELLTSPDGLHGSSGLCLCASAYGGRHNILREQPKATMNTLKICENVLPRRFADASYCLSRQTRAVIDQLIRACVAFLNMPLVTYAAVEGVQIRQPAKSGCSTKELQRPIAAGATRRLRRGHGTISDVSRQRT